MEIMVNQIICRGFLSFLVALALLAPSAGAQTADKPVASVGRGFYSDPIQVSLASETLDAEIRYTLDGSTPSESVGTELGLLLIAGYCWSLASQGKRVVGCPENGQILIQNHGSPRRLVPTISW